MEFKQFIRTPFLVDAVEITADNIAEIAELVGTLRTKDGTTFIALDRRLVPNVTRAYVGFYITKLGDNYRCYSPKAFKDQFTPHLYNPVTFDFCYSPKAFKDQFTPYLCNPVTFDFSVETPANGTTRPADAVYTGE